MAMNSFSPAGQLLGLGGGGVSGMNLGVDLQNQTIDETELLRRKRLQQMQQQQLLGVGGTGGSAAAQSLFSPLFTGGRGGF
jgi:hypothetical protein